MNELERRATGEVSKPLPADARMTSDERTALIGYCADNPTCSIADAARAAGIRKSLARKELRDDDDLAAAWDVARGRDGEKAVDVLWKVALDPEHPSWQRANAAVVRRYDRRYNDRINVDHDHTGQVDVTVEHVRRYTLADLLAAAGSLAGLGTSTGGQLPAARPLLAELVRGEPPASPVPVRPGT